MWTWEPIIVSGFLLFKELCVLSQIHFLYLLKLVLGWDLCPCSVDLGGDLLSVSISDLVRSLGSTQGCVSFFSFFWSLFQLVFLSLSFCFRCIILYSPRDSVQPSGISLQETFPSAVFHTTPFVDPLPPPELVVSRPGLGNLAHLHSLDPDHLRAGNIHNKLSFWHDLLEKSPFSEVDLIEVIRDGPRVDRFFKPFRGNFKGQEYNSEYPRPPLPSFHSSFPIA